MSSRKADADVLLRNARLRSGGSLTDLLITSGRVALVPAGTKVDGEQIDLDGRMVLPGLWDAHVHFDQWSAAKRRLDLSLVRSARDLTVLVACRLREEPPPPGMPLVGYGFRDGLWPDVPHLSMLDAVAPDIAVVMVSGDLHCAWLNSAALALFGRPGHATGVLREQEWLPVMNRVVQIPEPVGDEWAVQASRAAAARGVVGIVDFEAPDNTLVWQRRIAAGNRDLRVICSVWPTKLDDAIARGLRSGDPVAGTDGLAVMGPLKVITDGSLNTRTAYCHDRYPGVTGPEAHGILAVPPAELVPLMHRARAAGLETSIHAIGDHANSLVLDAFAATACSGTIEHAQLLDRTAFARFAALGITASIQPEHAMDDRDVADRHWAGRTGRAFAYADLHRAGARLALGSDAPVAPLDPWIAIAAAVSRTRDERAPWHPEQALPIEVAMAASAQGRSVVRDFDVADLIVLEHDPYTATASLLREMPVAATMLGGRWTHRVGG